MRALALCLGLVWLVPAAAHPPPMPEDTESASEMLRKKRKKPFGALVGSEVADKQAYGREGYVDLRSVVVTDADPLVVEVELWEPVVPDPGGLIVFLVPEGAMRFKFAAYQPEEGEWGFFGLSGRDVFEDRIGSATFVQDLTRITVTIPRADIPLDDFLVHVHSLSGPDNDNLWKDDAPNGREGIGVPARTEEDLAR